MNELIFLNGWMGEKMDGKNGQMDGKWTNKRMDKQINKWMDKRINKWMDE